MDWDLAERSKKCDLCQKQFSTGDNYKSALFLESEKAQESLPSVKKEFSNKMDVYLKNTGQRVELCPECWEQNIKNDQYDFFWEGEMIKTNTSAQPIKKFNKEGILSHLKEFIQKSLDSNLTEDERIENNGIAYFLAIMLERKNVISHRKDVIDEHTSAKCALYEKSKTGETFIIKYPVLSQENIQRYQEKITELIEPPKSTES